MVTGLAWEVLPSPVGELHVACSGAGLAQVRFGPPPGRPVPPDAQRAGPGGAPPTARAAAAEACRQLAAYFAGRLRAFTVPVDWSWASGTQQRVLSVLLAAAGYGETVTYGELASRAGLPDDCGPGAAGGHRLPARVVGQVMGSNQCPVVVPCHRVVAGNGLGGYSGGIGTEVKRWLLVFEGALPPTLDWDPAGVSGARPG